MCREKLVGIWACHAWLRFLTDLPLKLVTVQQGHASWGRVQINFSFLFGYFDWEDVVVLKRTVSCVFWWRQLLHSGSPMAGLVDFGTLGSGVGGLAWRQGGGPVCSPFLHLVY